MTDMTEMNCNNNHPKLSVNDDIFMKSLKKRKKNIFASCYPMSENIFYLYKTYFGPSKKHSNKSKFIDNSCIISENVKNKYRIAIIGDIMDFKGKKVSIDDEINAFLGDCDVLIGNFEGTITNKKGLFKSQKISEDALDVLSCLPVKRKVMSIANNHSGDFGWNEFKNTVKKLEDVGIEVIGLDKNPVYEVFEDLRFLTGTIWSNLKCDYISKLNDFSSLNIQNQEGVYNLLYPHWGYEFELFPRPNIIKKAKSLLKYCDGIFGTHPHVPQPITVESVNCINKIVCYSNGNFITGQSKEMKQHGLIVKMDIGLNDDDIMAAGKLEWRRNRCEISESGIKVKIEN